MHPRLLPLLLLSALPRPAVSAAAYFYGCYTEGATTRALNATAAPPETFPKMTPQLCADFCVTQHAHKLFGLEYGGECYCGDALQPGAFATFAGQCATPCTGDKTQKCGGASHLSLYGLATQKPEDKPVGLGLGQAAATQFRAVGCFAEGSDRRVLAGKNVADGEMTVPGCGSYCKNSGFLVFGVEYGRECYCGGYAEKEQMKQAKETECDMKCEGEKGQVCGGASRLSVYEWYDSRIH